jgi:hypothetical protein
MVSVPSIRMRVAVNVGGRGEAGKVGVLLGNSDGELVTMGVATGSGVPQATPNKASIVNRKASFFICWILLLLR